MLVLLTQIISVICELPFVIILGHLFELDHDEDNHGEDVEDDQKARADSDGQIVPEVVNSNKSFDIIPRTGLLVYR